MLERLQTMLERMAPRLRLARAYQATFDTLDGKRVLHDILREGGVLTTSMFEGDQGHATAFREGKRALALHVLERLRWSEAEIVAFAQERTSAQINEFAEAA